MAKGYINHKTELLAMRKRSGLGGFKKLVHRKNTGARGIRTGPDGPVEVDLSDEDIHVLVDSDEPPEGWDAFLAQNIRYDIKCQQCGEMVPEVRPFGKDHESICEACADEDPQMTELRWRELNPNG